MIKKIFLTLVLLILFPNSVNASTTSNYAAPIPTISKTYTEGFYKFNNSTNVDIGILLTTNTPTKIMILDEEMNIEYMSLVPYNYKFYLRNIAPGKIIALVGDGEVAISFLTP
ncbi:hypothetical protein [Clostridium sp.]|uniref:hypothetical protein n=1 Tax=Clostridium sp. TaxID=1506 RepID=UPI0025B80D7A|nr:hypothetical protein [Clostridium sp.]